MKQLQHLWIVWGALFMALVIYGTVPFNGLVKPQDGGRDLPPLFAQVLVAISLLVASGTIVARRSLLLRPLLTGRLSLNTRKGVARFSAVSLVIWVLSESIGIYGLVLYMMSGDVRYLYSFLVAAALLLAYHAPRTTGLPVGPPAGSPESIGLGGANSACSSCGISLGVSVETCPACGQSNQIADLEVEEEKPPLSTAQRLAGVALLLNSLLAVLVVWVASPAESMSTAISGAVTDLAMGLLLLLGRPRVLAFVRFAVVAGAFLFVGKAAADAQALQAGIQLTYSLAVAARIFGKPGRARVTVAMAALVCVFSLAGFGIYYGLTGKRPLAAVISTFNSDLVALPSGSAKGGAFPFSIDLGSERWHRRSESAARAENPLADLWVTIPAYDASILVIAETVPEGQRVALDRFTEAVIQNGEKATAQFEILDSDFVESRTGTGRFLDVDALVQETSARIQYGIFTGDGYAIQILCMSHPKVFSEIEDDCATAFASFSFPAVE